MSVKALIADARYSIRHPWIRIGAIAAAAAAVVALIALAFWWPAQSTRATLEEQIAIKRRTLVQLQQADELLHTYERAQKDVPVLEKKLTNAATQAQLVEQLGRLARRHGVTVLSETYEEGRAAGSYAVLNTELTVQAGYPAIREFLRSLPDLPVWAEVQELRLEAARDAGAVKGRIRIATYRRARTSGAAPS
ncbi:MAG TPA: type 4a pilus biogenesis protein PilO [Burkholderiales bacterium]|nr:type 4a pilus biogenesis protein PilO [Burkholderiales bacterium]